jgi:predicted metalloprotease
MRWKRGSRSSNLEDRRGARPRLVPLAGGGKVGLGGILILVVLSVLFREDLTDMLGLLEGDTGTYMDASVQSTPEEELLVDFVSYVLDDAQTTWGSLLPQLGISYRDARLVLFRDAVGSACGFAQAAAGPFYCPGDERVYLDLSFFEELQRRFAAPGDFAQAYVIAHEIGHHVQNVLGIAAEVRRAQEQRPDLANDLSVRMELQADCYAGVWGHSSARRDILEPGDVEEGLAAAAAVGDDRIQRQATGRINPDAFTHGSSAQRVEWFRRGLATGDPRSCDTFGGSGG